ncbi:hypothetical protein KBD08_01145 [Candidatus Babeliales bacterium]|nr:hypothetical protein [Candidatus Babeliales bacterium]
MLKKSMFIVALLGVTELYSDNNPAVVVGVIGGATVVAGTAIYIAAREPNPIKIDRAYKTIDLYQMRVQSYMKYMNTTEGIMYFVNQPQSFMEIGIMVEHVEQVYKDIKKRYGSWFTPWNWTHEMKKAYDNIGVLYNDIVVLKYACQYAPLIRACSYCHQSYTPAQMLIAARAVCAGTTSYPLMECVDHIRDLVRTIKYEHRFMQHHPFTQIMEYIVKSLVATSEYIQERQAYEQYKQQQRVAQAAESQASAAWAQAEAQNRQARALEERNRLER